MVDHPPGMREIAGSSPAGALLQKKLNISWDFNYMCSPSQTTAWRETQEIQNRRFSDGNKNDQMGHKGT